MFTAFNTVAATLDTIHGNAGILQERIEQPYRIGTATHTGDQPIRQAAGLLQYLCARFAADDGLEIAHHGRVGMRPGYGTDNVEGVIDIGHPVAHGLVKCILQRSGTRLDRDHFGAQQAHAVNVDGLALDILAPHVHNALHTQTRSNSRRCHAVLPGAGFRNHAFLAQTFSEQRLAYRIVYLVRTGMVEIFPFQVDLCPAQLPAPALCVVQR